MSRWDCQAGFGGLCARENEQAERCCEPEHRDEPDRQGASLHAPGRLLVGAHPHAG